MIEARRALGASLSVAALATVLYTIHPAFFVKDDFQLQYLPGSREIVRAWSAGTPPLLSPYSWLCTALGAEYQFGVFSPVRTLLDLLVWIIPFSLTARGALLFIIHAAIGAAGGWLLARSHGGRPASAAMVAVIAGLNGWILWWGTTWYPGIASFAWLPWYWLALRGIAERRGRWSWLGAAVSLDLIVTAGWPYGVAMAAAVTIMMLVSALARRRWSVALTILGASALGLCLAAPAVLMLLEYFRSTARVAGAAAVDVRWVVPPAALFGLVMPSFSVPWPVFSGRSPRAAVELAGAFVPIAVVVAAGRRAWRDRIPELLLIVAVVVLILMPSAGPFRWSFRWLPLLHLALAIVAASALDQAGRRAPVSALALLLVTLAAAAAVGRDLRITAVHGVLAAALAVVWLLFERRGSRVATLMPAGITAVMIVVTFLAFARRSDVPTWDWDERLLSPAPLDVSRRYLALYPLDDVIAKGSGIDIELRPGNTPMLAGVELINGYSPLGLAALHNLFAPDGHGPLRVDRAERLVASESGRGQLLEHLGVDGLIVPEVLARRNASHLAQEGWQPVARIASCLVLHRDGDRSKPAFTATAVFRTNDEVRAYAAIFGSMNVVVVTGSNDRIEHFEPRILTRIRQTRLDTTAWVAAGSRSILVFRRPWLPGWRATLDGKPLHVLRADMVMPAVEIPPGSAGVVRLVYRPASLIAGAVLAVAALVVIAVLSLRVAKT